MRVILASSSPRRKELLELMDVEFETMKPERDEDMTSKMSIYKLSEVLSKQKAQEIFDRTEGDRIVIGSDCMVYQHGKKIGKAKDREEAFDMLSHFSGKWHKVITGLCVMVQDGDRQTTYLEHSTTKVKFKKLTDEDINRYLDTGDYIGKSGACSIQGKSGMFVDKIVGNVSTVVGLPTHLLHDILKKENIIK